MAFRRSGVRTPSAPPVFKLNPAQLGPARLPFPEPSREPKGHNRADDAYGSVSHNLRRDILPFECGRHFERAQNGNNCSEKEEKHTAHVHRRKYVASQGPSFFSAELFHGGLCRLGELWLDRRNMSPYTICIHPGKVGIYPAGSPGHP